MVQPAELTDAHADCVPPAMAPDRASTRPVADQKRLLFVAAAFPPRRVPEADHALQQCLHIAARGIAVHVLTTRDQTVAAAPNLTPHAVLDSWSWTELPKLVRLLREIRPDAVLIYFLGHLYEYRIMPTMIPLVAKLLLRRVAVLAEFSNLGQGLGLKPGLKKALFRHVRRYRYGSLFASSDAVIVMGEDHRRRVVALSPETGAKTHILPPCPLMPISDDHMAARRAGRTRLGIAEDDVLVVMFGRLYPGKGIEALIEAVARVAPEFPKLRLGLIGGVLEEKTYYEQRTSYRDVLDALIAERGIADIVRFSGEYRWGASDASEYLHAADLAVLPLESGIHLNNSSLAAVCTHGVPVVGTRGPVTDPVLRHGENVYFIDGSSSDRIEQALRRVLRDPALLHRLHEGSLDIARENFDWQHATDRLSRLMRLC